MTSGNHKRLYDTMTVHRNRVISVCDREIGVTVHR